ncbi:MAG: hypothetical protein AB8E15_11390 [Bdellovibrionales bacterium]
MKTLRNGTMMLLALLLVDQGQAEDRRLKYRVSADSIQTSTFDVPGDKQFDFGFVINSLLQAKLGTHKDFFSLLNANNQRLALDEVGTMGLESGSSTVGSIGRNGKDIPACLTSGNMFRLYGQVLSFEMNGGFGFKVGYNRGVDQADGWGAEVEYKVQKGSLNFILMATPEHVNSPIAQTMISESSKNSETNFTVNYNELSLSPRYFHESNLAKVSERAVEKSLDRTAAQIRDSNDSNVEWSSTIVASDDPLYILPVGSRDGLKVGDIFDVVGTVHEWEGKPCQSNHVPYEVGKVGRVVITSTNFISARARRYNEDDPWLRDILPGDKIVLHKFAD